MKHNLENVTLLCCDIAKLNEHLPSREYAELVWADPPRLTSSTYNLDGVPREERYRLTTLTGYAQFAREWLSQALKASARNSWLVVCCNTKNRHFYESLIEEEFPSFKFELEVIWHFEFGVYRKTNFVPSHENLLIYSRGDPSFFWDRVLIPSQRLLSGDERADLRGRNPGTVWNIPRVPGNSKQRKYITGEARSCQPEELCDRFVKAYTTPQGIVLDLFAGTGSMAFVCYRLNRKYVGVDISERYIKEIHDRLTLGVEEKVAQMIGSYHATPKHVKSDWS